MDIKGYQIEYLIECFTGSITEGLFYLFKTIQIIQNIYIKKILWGLSHTFIKIFLTQTRYTWTANSRIQGI